MILLCADTSSSRFSVALFKSGELVDTIESVLANRHSSELLPAIDKLLSRHTCTINDIDAFAVGLGPGSFTGLRVGITTMRGLALALKKPIVGIPSIDGIAYNVCGHPGQICPVIDARQNRIYCRLYRSEKKRIKPLSGFLLVTPKELLEKIKGPTIFLGDALPLYGDMICAKAGALATFAPEAFWYPKASIIGAMGMERLDSGKKDNVYTLSPLYIYPKECQVKKIKN